MGTREGKKAEQSINLTAHFLPILCLYSPDTLQLKPLEDMTSNGAGPAISTVSPFFIPGNESKGSFLAS